MHTSIFTSINKLLGRSVSRQGVRTKEDPPGVRTKEYCLDVEQASP